MQPHQLTTLSTVTGLFHNDRFVQSQGVADQVGKVAGTTSQVDVRPFSIRHMYHL